MMKVLNVVTHLDPVTGGGCTERTLQMSRSLVKSGVETTILTTDYGLTEARRRELKGIKLCALPCLIPRFYLPKVSRHEIRDLVAASDIVHLIGHWSLLNTLVYVHLRKMHKPYVVCPAGALPITGRSKILKNIYNFIIGKSIIRNANAGIAIAKNEIMHFHSYGVNSDKVFHIPNGINYDEGGAIEVSSFRKKHGLDDVPFILFIGRLNAIKGPDLLLEAFCEVMDQLRPYHLVFVGPDSGLLGSLKAGVINYEAEDRVHFLDYLGGDEKQQAFHAADLVVIPSRQEAMSIVVLEAGITGTPVLITDQCGFDEVALIDGGSVVPATREGIKAGLLELLKKPEELQNKGANLQNYIGDNFTWDVIITSYLQLYQKIL